MAFSSINSSDIQVGKPQTQVLWTQVKDNFDALNTSLTSDSQQDISGTQTIADQTVNGTFVITDTGSTFTLPLVSNNSGLIIRFIQQGNGSSTLQGNGAETINGVSTYGLPKIYAAATLYCDGDEWHVIYESSEVYYKNSGSASAPAGALASDPDTGFYWSAADQFALAAGGELVFRVTDTSFKFFKDMDGQIIGDGGSVSAPVIVPNTNDNDTGMYAFTPGLIQFGVGGVEKFRISSSGASIQSGQMFVLDGSVGAPGFTFSNDPDSGAYRTGSNVWRLGAGGGGRMQIDTLGIEFISGNVRFASGIQCLLDDGTVSEPGWAFNSDTDTGVYKRPVTGGVSFAVGGAERFSVQSGAVVVRDGQLYLQDGSVSDPALRFLNDDDNGIALTGTDQISIITNGAKKIEFNSGTIDVLGTVRPETDSTYDLGASSLRYSNVYCDVLRPADTGTYTPTATVTNGTYVAASSMKYYRVGDMVHVAGRIRLETNISGDVTFRISLPVAASFSSAYDLTGFCQVRLDSQVTNDNVPEDHSFHLHANTVANDLLIDISSSSPLLPSTDYSFILDFTYEV